MNFEDLKRHVERDMKVDDTQLDLESLKIPQLHNKYLNFLQEERFNLKKMGFDFASLRRSKWEFYTGKMSEEDLEEKGWEPFDLKILKSDIDMYLDSDNDMILMKQKITYQEEKVFYLESVIKEIGQRNWEIRNAIEWRKFVSGS
jgi:hypothetical protein|tara:strand:+ start:906 stop:1340 length:435 start_codon:yes stop_codon:yes gene_type:complete